MILVDEMVIRAFDDEAKELEALKTKACIFSLLFFFLHTLFAHTSPKASKASMARHMSCRLASFSKLWTPYPSTYDSERYKVT